MCSQKSSRDTTTPATGGGVGSQGAAGSESGLTYSDSGSGSQPGFAYTDSGYGSGSVTGSGAGSGAGSGGTILADGSWLAGLAMGGSTKTDTPTTLIGIASAAFVIVFSLRKL